ncbi:hypothetical protein [Mycobacterium sp. ACS4331]|uniref:hypothetical protein n=1 Tax=Mycobacterium sp. ACS4331 TaxID=1834121 RepID=UPI000AF6E141|nr:hypothetical protein [Mycobacterium sp. ACS4331]
MAVGAAVVVVAALVLVALSRGPNDTASAPVSVPSAPTVTVGDGRIVTSLSLGGESTDAVLRRAEADLALSAPRVERFWGTDWSDEIVVVATGTDAEFAAAAPGAPAGVAAVAVADAVDPLRRTAEGQRIVLGPGAGRMSDEALRLVLTHELFHYAARPDTAADAPRWVTEGVADYVARSGPVPAMPAPTRLPSDNDFSTHGGQLSEAYDRAWLFARFIADRYGEPALRDLYTAAAGPGHRDTDTALRQVTGTAPADLLDQWRAWLAAAAEPR